VFTVRQNGNRGLISACTNSRRLGLTCSQRSDRSFDHRAELHRTLIESA
jgi:hypothetical protein